MADGDAEEIHGAYGPNDARLAALKAKYDATNLLRLNATIVPDPPVG